MPYATMRFVHLGWRVIRVESTGGGDQPGDPNRYIGGPVPGIEPYSYFLAQNVGKECVALNLKTPEGRAALHRMIRELDADVFTCNTIPSRYEQLGIDYETLSAVKPGLIWAGISAMGPDYPRGRRLRPGHPGHVRLHGSDRLRGRSADPDGRAGGRSQGRRRGLCQCPAGARRGRGQGRRPADRRLDAPGRGVVADHAPAPDRPGLRPGGDFPLGQRPPQVHPDQRLPDQRRLYLHRRRQQRPVAPPDRDRPLRPGREGRRARHAGSPLRRPRRRSTGRSARRPGRRRWRPFRRNCRRRRSPTRRSTRSRRFTRCRRSARR